MITNINSNNFKEEVIDSKLPVIIDLWAPWCGPCRSFAPTFEKVAEDYKDKVKFTKVNVDENSDIAQQYGVRSIPSLVIVKDGEQKNFNAGSLEKEGLKKFIDDNI